MNSLLEDSYKSQCEQQENFKDPPLNILMKTGRILYDNNKAVLESIKTQYLDSCYVNNPNGGDYICYWYCMPQLSRDNNPDHKYTAHLASVRDWEENSKNNIKILAENYRSDIRNQFYNNLSDKEIKSKCAKKLSKPARFGDGKYMTVMPLDLTDVVSGLSVKDASEKVADEIVHLAEDLNKHFVL